MAKLRRLGESMTGVNEIACAGLLIYTTKVDYFSHEAICSYVIEWE